MQHAARVRCNAAETRGDSERDGTAARERFVHGRDVVRAVVDDHIDAPTGKVDRFLQRTT
jgi:hypothetical protein